MMNVKNYEDVGNKYLKEVLSEKKIELLKKAGYFDSPASSNKHLAVKGGLFAHSVNVTKTMLDLNDKMNLGLERKNIILAGMLHDICKAGSYAPNVLKSGKVSEAKPYIYSNDRALGHSTDSLYIIYTYLDVKLPLVVSEAIYWHMGFKFPDDNGEINILKSKPLDIIYVWLLQTADRFATWIMEE